MDPKNPILAPSPTRSLEQYADQGQWTTGFYDCCDDPSNCLMTWICPCVIFGRIAEIIDRGERSCGQSGLIFYALLSIHGVCIYGARYRAKLRQLFSLPEAPYGDRFVHCCCNLCALSQEYRELRNRGVDPYIGWEANVNKWKREGLKPPIPSPGMDR